MTSRRSYTVEAATPIEPDDLTRIKGIGSKIATRLRDTGILTFTQLANLAPEDIARRVVGLPAKRIESENWIKQAQKLAENVESHYVPSSETASEFRQHYATFTVELLLYEDNSVRRTHITYHQNKLEEIWDNWEERKLVNFITNCAGLHPALSEPPLPLSISPNNATPLPEAAIPSMPTPEIQLRERLPHSRSKVVLSGVLRVNELVTLQMDSKEPQYIAHANETLNVHILLDLTEVKASAHVPLNCTVTVWAKKLGTGARQIIGEQQSLSMPGDKIPCLVESMIPSKGTYRLEAVVNLTPASTVRSPSSTLRAWYEGNLLQVN